MENTNKNQGNTTIRVRRIAKPQVEGSQAVQAVHNLNHITSTVCRAFDEESEKNYIIPTIDTLSQCGYLAGLYAVKAMLRGNVHNADYGLLQGGNKMAFSLLNDSKNSQISVSVKAQQAGQAVQVMQGRLDAAINALSRALLTKNQLQAQQAEQTKGIAENALQEAKSLLQGAEDKLIITNGNDFDDVCGMAIVAMLEGIRQAQALDEGTEERKELERELFHNGLKAATRAIHKENNNQIGSKIRLTYSAVDGRLLRADEYEYIRYSHTYLDRVDAGNDYCIGETIADSRHFTEDSITMIDFSAFVNHMNKVSNNATLKAALKLYLAGHKASDIERILGISKQNMYYINTSIRKEYSNFNGR